MAGLDVDTATFTEPKLDGSRRASATTSAAASPQKCTPTTEHVVFAPGEI